MSKIIHATIFLLLISTSISLAQTSISEMPANLKESIEWVWNNRIVPKSASAPIGEGSTVRQNLIFDQIYDAGGSLNYVVRWQSTKTLSLAQRQGLQTMIQRQINNWTQYLTGFEGWPYANIPVKIVGYAVDNAALILDPQPGEVIYTTYSYDAVHDQDATIPGNLPYAPDNCSRFEHFTDASYTYASCPQGSQGRFDMYLWATANWKGGVGGDWGQRMAEDYYLNNINTAQLTMTEHEIGHGFGITDFYGATERPPNGFPTTLIMWAGNSSTITQWDAWMLRYIWSQLKKDQTRFPPRTPSSSSSVATSSSSVKPSSSSVVPSSSSVKPSSSSVVPSSSSVKPISSSIAPSSSAVAPSSSASTPSQCIAFVNGVGNYDKSCYNSGLLSMAANTCYTMNPARTPAPDWINNTATNTFWWVTKACSTTPSSSSTTPLSSSAMIPVSSSAIKVSSSAAVPVSSSAITVSSSATAPVSSSAITASSSATVLVSSSAIMPSSSAIQLSSSSIAPVCTQSIIPYININSGASLQVASINVQVGDDILIAPQPTDLAGIWSWTSPTGIITNSRELNMLDVLATQTGSYVAKLDLAGCTYTSTVQINVQSTTSTLRITQQHNTNSRLITISGNTLQIPVPKGMRTIRLHTLFGRLIAEEKLGSGSVWNYSTAGLPKGLYLVQFR